MVVLGRHAAGETGAGYLPDVNVWPALAVQGPPHHVQSAGYRQREAADWRWFRRATILWLVRLLTKCKLIAAGTLDSCPH